MMSHVLTDCHLLTTPKIINMEKLYRQPLLLPREEMTCMYMYPEMEVWGKSSSSSFSFSPSLSLQTDQLGSRQQESSCSFCNRSGRLKFPSVLYFGIHICQYHYLASPGKV